MVAKVAAIGGIDWNARSAASGICRDSVRAAAEHRVAPRGAAMASGIEDVEAGVVHERPHHVRGGGARGIVAVVPPSLKPATIGRSSPECLDQGRDVVGEDLEGRRSAEVDGGAGAARVGSDDPEVLAEGESSGRRSVTGEPAQAGPVDAERAVQRISGGPSPDLGVGDVDSVCLDQLGAAAGRGARRGSWQFSWFVGRSGSRRSDASTGRVGRADEHRAVRTTATWAARRATRPR